MDAAEKKALRKQLYVNQPFQRSVISRTIMQWYFYLSAILLVVSLGSAWVNPEVFALKHLFRNFIYFLPGVIASVLLLPLFIYDMLKETNKIAGPIFRLRCEMQKLKDGQQLNDLRFRDGDSWEELADDFNSLVAQIQNERRVYDENDQKQKVYATNQ
jgi:signal transduction histidine kinase